MSIGLFTNRNRQPMEAEIVAALGGAKALWNGLLAETRSNPKVAEDFRFMYGRNYGWALSFCLRGNC
jgi:hypothetical protein